MKVYQKECQDIHQVEIYQSTYFSEGSVVKASEGRFIVKRSPPLSHDLLHPYCL